MTKQYRKKPVIVEAVQFFDTPECFVELSHFVDNQMLHINRKNPFDTKIIIETLEGEMTASVGDYIIKGVQGEFYPCKPDIFEATYEAVMV